MSPPPPLTSAQIRAARALIRWSAEDLANHCAVSVTTIRRAELMPSATALTRVNDAVIRQALEKAGVEFIDEKWRRARSAVVQPAIREKIASGPTISLHERQWGSTHLPARQTTISRNAPGNFVAQVSCNEAPPLPVIELLHDCTCAINALEALRFVHR